MRTPKVAVVVPLYNKAPYIGRALDSILAQQFDDLEVVVVDDGSTDEGPEIVACYTDPRVRLIRQSNAGPGAARNRALEVVRSPLVAFLDADDEWLPGYLERAVGVLSRTPEAVSFTCGYLECPGDRPSAPMWRRRGIVTGIQTLHPGTRPRHMVDMVAFMTPCSTVMRAGVIRKWGGFHDRPGSRYGEDALLWMKVMLNEKVFFDLDPGIRIHTDASALSKNLPGPRPLDAFLQHPEEVENACPPELRALLAAVYSIRAFKTACVWSYWGKWREARELRRRFRSPGDYKHPFYLASALLADACGSLPGRLTRALIARKPREVPRQAKRGAAKECIQDGTVFPFECGQPVEVEARRSGLGGAPADAGQDRASRHARPECKAERETPPADRGVAG